jgi:hypothetical protein
MSASRRGIVQATPRPPKAITSSSLSQSLQGATSRTAAEKRKRTNEIPESDVEVIEQTACPPFKKVSLSQGCTERRK